MPEAFSFDLNSRDNPLNISRHEQRVLHVLAQGGEIRFERMANGKIRNVHCFSRDGFLLGDFDMKLFMRLRKRQFIRSEGGRPYRVTRFGLGSVHAQHDNR